MQFLRSSNGQGSFDTRSRLNALSASNIAMAATNVAAQMMTLA